MRGSYDVLFLQRASLVTRRWRNVQRAAAAMSNAPLQQRAAVATRQYSNASQQQRATRLPVFLPLSHLLIFSSRQSSLTLHDSFSYPCSSLIICDHRLRADGSIYFCSFLSGASASSSRSEHGHVFRENQGRR